MSYFTPDDPGKLWKSITMAEAKRDESLGASFDDDIRAYHGPYHRREAPESESKEWEPENHGYEYVSYFLPQAVYRSPRVRITTRRPAFQKDVASAIQWGVNRWILDTNYRRVLEQSCVDFCFRYKVSLVTQEPHPGSHEPEDPIMWPQVYRVSPKHAFWDSMCLNIEQAKFVGHKWTINKDELIAIAERDAQLPESKQQGWDLDAVRAVAATSDKKDMYPRNQHTEDRDEVTVYEVWVPGVELEESEGADEGYHGTLFTIAQEQPTPGMTSASTEGDRVRWLRNPRPYYGPRWGPYVISGAYTVPDDSVPLSPIIATRAQAKDLNDTVQAQAEQNRRYKRLVVVDEEQDHLAQRLQDAPHDYILGLPGIGNQPNRVQTLEIGGASQTMEVYAQIARERLDRISGMDDAQRGNADPTATATAVAVAASSAKARSQWVVDRFTDSVRRELMSVAWFMYHEWRVVFPLGEEAAEELGQIEPFFFGGFGRQDRTQQAALVKQQFGMELPREWVEEGESHRENTGVSFDDLGLKIEPYSMQRMDEGLQQRRMMDMTAFLTGLLPIMLQAPDAADWKKLVDVYGDWMNVSELGEILKPENFSKYAQQLQQQGGSSMPQMRPEREATPGTMANRPGVPRMAGNAAGAGARNGAAR